MLRKHLMLVLLVIILIAFGIGYAMFMFGPPGPDTDYKKYCIADVESISFNRKANIWTIAYHPRKSYVLLKVQADSTTANRAIRFGVIQVVNGKEVTSLCGEPSPCPGNEK